VEEFCEIKTVSKDVIVQIAVPYLFHTSVRIMAALIMQHSIFYIDKAYTSIIFFILQVAIKWPEKNS
jgi:hypothetical protein